MKTLRLLAVGALLAMLTGCMNYYRVTDTVNGTDYYTKSLKDFRSGAVAFTDKRSGARVTLQSYKVEEIPRSEYKEAVR